MANLDQIMDYLADSVEDTGWQIWENFNYYRRKSGVVYVQIYKNVSLSSSWTTLFTLPAGYRPFADIYFVGTTVTSNTNIIGAVQSSNGAVMFRVPSGSASVSVEAQVVFPV